VLDQPLEGFIVPAGIDKVAFAITGSRWNGPRFFGLRDKIEPVSPCILGKCREIFAKCREADIATLLKATRSQ